MRFGVVQFPGTCDERDALLAASRVGRAELLWHGEPTVGDVDAVIVPGGFSYGDYLRAGAIAARSPIMDAVRAFAAEGGPVLGICNGFQVLCEAGLLPGALLPNAGRRFVCRQVLLEVASTASRWTARAEVGQHLSIPAKHQGGRWYAPPELLDELRDADQVLLRYRPGHDVNGSVDRVAGVRNAAGNVAGLMPHPEHAVEPLLGSADGLVLLRSVLDGVRAAA